MDTSAIIERTILEFHRSYECVANSIVSRDLKSLKDMPSAGIAMCVILLQIIILSLYRSRQIIYQILDSIVAIVLLVSLLVIVFGLPIAIGYLSFRAVWFLVINLVKLLATNI